jgi:AraC-like DNA-binding protein
MRWQHLLYRPRDTDYGLVARDEVFSVHAARPPHTRGRRGCCHPAEVEISFLLSGVRHGEIAGQRQTLRAGQYDYFPPGVPHSTETREEGIAGFYVQLPVELFRDARAEIGGELWRVSRPVARPIFPELRGILLALQRQAETPEHDEMPEALGFYLAGYLLREHCPGARPVGLSSAGQEVGMSRVIELMHSCFDEALTLDQLAEAAGLSRFRFAHVFKARFGLTPYRYLERVRSQRAALLLRERGRTISEVAYEIGFPSSSRFAQVFRREFGVLPSVWQREISI